MLKKTGLVGLIVGVAAGVAAAAFPVVRRLAVG